MKKIVIAVVVGTLVVLAGVALAVYAAYDISGSGAGGFTNGTAADLAVDPDEADLNGILPGETKTMDVTITNNNSGPATVTGLSLSLQRQRSLRPFVRARGQLPVWPWGRHQALCVQVNVTMGNADPSCEG